MEIKLIKFRKFYFLFFQHGEVIHTTYNALMDKIESYQPSPTAPVEQIDSPLMSVPAPTPAHSMM